METGLPDKSTGEKANINELNTDNNRTPSLSGNPDNSTAGESIKNIIEKFSGNGKSNKSVLEATESHLNESLNKELNGAVTSNNRKEFIPKFSKQVAPENPNQPVNIDPSFTFSIEVPQNVIVRVKDILGIESPILFDDFVTPGNYIVRINRKEFRRGTAYYRLYVEVPYDTEFDFDTFDGKPGKKYRLIEVKEVEIT